MAKIEYPLFELYGPKCKTLQCKGVLINHLEIKSKIWFKKCSICKIEMPTKEERIIKNIIE